jgi:hypothetical protein
MPVFASTALVDIISGPIADKAVDPRLIEISYPWRTGAGKQQNCKFHDIGSFTVVFFNSRFSTRFTKWIRHQTVLVQRGTENGALPLGTRSNDGFG